MSKNDVTNIVCVGKAVLTPKAIERLERYQRNNEWGVDVDRDAIADAVCFIGKCLSNIPKDYHSEAHEIINGLSLVRDNINDFKKP